jgi:hypothetical protein
MPYYLTLAEALTNIRRAIGEESSKQWLDLDHFLAQFWESRSIRPKFISTAKRGMGDHIGCLLPGITKRGIIDILEC